MIRGNAHIGLIVSTLFCGVCLAGFIIFFIKVESHKEELAAETKTYTEKKAREENLERLTQTLGETKEDRVSLLSRFPHEEDIVMLLAEIEQLGDETGTLITTNSLTVRPIDATFETLVITMSMEGSYTALMQVFALLEALPYQVTIGNVQLERIGDEGSRWKAGCEIRITKFKNI
jgi:Tfp pilus assembly protein PilO